MISLKNNYDYVTKCFGGSVKDFTNFLKCRILEILGKMGKKKTLSPISELESFLTAPSRIEFQKPMWKIQEKSQRVQLAPFTISLYTIGLVVLRAKTIFLPPCRLRTQPGC